MKKALILTSIIFTAFISMAQTVSPVLHANTKVMVDSTTLLIDSSEHSTCNFKEANVIKSTSRSSSINNGKAKVVERPERESHNSSAVFRRRNSTL